MLPIVDINNLKYTNNFASNNYSFLNEILKQNTSKWRRKTIPYLHLLQSHLALQPRLFKLGIQLEKVQLAALGDFHPRRAGEQ
jgi:hypothetical protein